MNGGNDEQGFQADFEGEEYKVSHKNEKFAIGALGSKAVDTSSLEKDTEQALKASSLAQEEKELAEALQKIREMENQEELKIDTEGQVLEYLKQGDLVYELYSVLVHSGSAMGGHYYAYIKSFEDGKWYNFNDSDVRPIDAADI